ncbi:hypothetical protein FQZ97_686440 [compost metagenome]
MAQLCRRDAPLKLALEPCHGFAERLDDLHLGKGHTELPLCDVPRLYARDDLDFLGRDHLNESCTSPLKMAHSIVSRVLSAPCPLLII